MATRLTYRIWDGGDGKHDRFIHLFECKETPQEVLMRLFKNHLVYSYKNLYTPIDRSFPNNAEGIIIEDIPLEDDYSKEITSLMGISIHSLNVKRIKGYNSSIGRSPLVFEKTIAGHIKSELGSKFFYNYRGLERLLPLKGQNYLCVRNSPLIAELKQDKTGIEYYYSSGEKAKNLFVGKKWVAEQEQMLQTIFEIAQVILEDIKEIDDLIPLYEKYKAEKAHVY